MSGVIVAVVFVAAYAALFWGILHWIRSRLFRRAQEVAEALTMKGAKIIGVRPVPSWGKPAEVEFELDGKHAFFRIQQYGRDWRLMTVKIDSAPLPGIWIQPEGFLVRIGKSVGMHKEVQVGDPAFDDAAYISSNASEDMVRRALEKPEVRRSILELLRLGYNTNMSPDGLAATHIEIALGGINSEVVPDVMRILETLAADVPRFDPATLKPMKIASIAWPVVGTLIGLLVGAIAFGASAVAMHPPVDPENSFKALALGVLPWLVVVALLFRALRNRIYALLELALGSLFALFGTCALTGAVLISVNSGLDSSPAVTHGSEVLTLPRRANTNVLVKPWDPARSSQQVIMTRAALSGLKVGDHLAVDVHAGALGWPWVSGRAPRRVTVRVPSQLFFWGSG